MFFLLRIVLPTWKILLQEHQKESIASKCISVVSNESIDHGANEDWRGYRHKVWNISSQSILYTIHAIYLDEISVLGVDSDDFQSIGATTQYPLVSLQKSKGGEQPLSF